MDLESTIPAMRKTECPYGADECPKVEETNDSIKHIYKRLLNIERILYVLVGVMAVECGIIVWRFDPG